MTPLLTCWEKLALVTTTMAGWVLRIAAIASVRNVLHPVLGAFDWAEKNVRSVPDIREIEDSYFPAGASGGVPDRRQPHSRVGIPENVQEPLADESP